MIIYSSELTDNLTERLIGFFEGWPNPPTPETHLRILRGSEAFVLAIDAESNMVVGFINAIGDGVLSAYIPLLEVLPDYRGHGIGSELVKRLMERLKEYYMVDLLCDDEVIPFYERLGFVRSQAMLKRNYEYQSGRP